MKKIVLLAIMLVSFPAMSFAAVATGSFYVYANVAAAGTCTVASPQISFGNIVPPITANIDTSGFFSVTCPSSTPYTVELSTGNGGDYYHRSMSNGDPASPLIYNIYTDATYATIWGDATSGTSTVAGVGNASAQSQFAYLRVTPQATPAGGSYSDIVTITVTY